MQSLYETLLACNIMEGTKTKFDKFVSTFDELLDNNPSLNAHKDRELVSSLITDIIEEADYQPEELFIYSEGGSFFKIPYAFNEAITIVIKQPKYINNFNCHVYGNKIKVYFTKRGGEIFETGSGSIGRVSTVQQETATCLVWNAYVDAVKENINLDMTDKITVKNIVSDLTASFDSEWISTFGKQVNTIIQYLESLGKNPLDYKLCRYGEKEAENSVGKAYESFIAAYTKAVEGHKDNFDPSDVILYKESARGTIVSKLKSYTGDPINNKPIFTKELFDTVLLQGISLKKIAGNKSGRYDRYNVGDGNKIEKVFKFSIDQHSNDKQIIVLCEGNFSFDNITDGDGEEIKNTPIVKLVMRSFGSGQTAIDCLIKEIKGKQSPSLGKCPARFWRKIINATKGCSLQENIEKFNEFLKGDTSSVLTGLGDIIKGSIKEGPNCFPFILLH